MYKLTGDLLYRKHRADTVYMCILTAIPTAITTTKYPMMTKMSPHSNSVPETAIPVNCPIYTTDQLLSV